MLSFFFMVSTGAATLSLLVSFLLAPLDHWCLQAQQSTVRLPHHVAHDECFCFSRKILTLEKENECDSFFVADYFFSSVIFFFSSTPIVVVGACHICEKN